MAQVSTSDNQDINVGTKINAFVYNTIAQWYNEDAKVGNPQHRPDTCHDPGQAPALQGCKEVAVEVSGRHLVLRMQRLISCTCMSVVATFIVLVGCRR